MATSVSSRSFNRTKQTKAAAQATASCFSMCVTVPKRALNIHRKQMTELSQPCWNLKVKTKNKILSLYQSTTHSSFLDPILLCKFHWHVAEHYRWKEICSAGLSGPLIFPEMVKSRLICTDALASPCLPICFFTDFMKDMSCIGCQTFMTSSATFTMCLSQPELVYCSVSLRQERWRLFYGYTDDCLALCTVSNAPSLATQLPEIHFPGIPDDFPCCSHFAICCPDTTVTRLGSLGEMERESPIFCI